MKSLDSLLERLDSLELEVGTSQFSPQSVDGDTPEQKTLVHELANLQARIDHIFDKDSVLRGLPEIIKTYHTGSQADSTIDSEVSETSGAESRSSAQVSVAEKQELIQVKYPELIKCYNQLVEFSALDVPKLSRELVDQLNLSSMLDKKALCNSIANQFHLLVVKSLIVYEEFVTTIKQQTAFLQNVNNRMRTLTAKLASFEHRRQMERKY